MQLISDAEKLNPLTKWVLLNLRETDHCEAWLKVLLQECLRLCSSEFLRKTHRDLLRLRRCQSGGRQGWELVGRRLKPWMRRKASIATRRVVGSQRHERESLFHRVQGCCVWWRLYNTLTLSHIAPCSCLQKHRSKTSLLPNSWGLAPTKQRYRLAPPALWGSVCCVASCAPTRSTRGWANGSRGFCTTPTTSAPRLWRILTSWNIFPSPCRQGFFGSWKDVIFSLFWFVDFGCSWGVN